MYEGTGSSGGLWHIPGFTRDVLTSNGLDRALCGMLVCDIRDLIAYHFICSGFSLVPRSNNSVAHELANLGLSWDPGHFQLWDGPLPDCVNFRVTHDLAKSVVCNIRP